jgi:hypothetical protein
MAAVMGIIGYTHGVRLVSTPAPKSSGSAAAGFPESCDVTSAIWSSTGK